MTSFDIEAFKADIPDGISALLGGASAPSSNAAEAERALNAALETAPDSLGLRIAAYTFYIYANRPREAIPHAEACLALAAEALGVPADWRLVGPDSAPFGELERPQRVYLKSLVAIGYCRARLGDVDGAEMLLRKAASLDPGDRAGAAALADLIARHRNAGEADDEDGGDDPAPVGG